MNPFEMKKVGELLNKECLNADAVFVAVLKGDVVYTSTYGKFLNKGKMINALKKYLKIKH